MEDAAQRLLAADARVQALQGERGAEADHQADQDARNHAQLRVRPRGRAGKLRERLDRHAGVRAGGEGLQRGQAFAERSLPCLLGRRERFHLPFERRHDRFDLAVKGSRALLDGGQCERVGDRLRAGRGRRGGRDRHDVALSDRDGADLAEQGTPARVADLRRHQGRNFRGGDQARRGQDVGGRVGGVRDQAQPVEVGFAVHGRDEQVRFSLPLRRSQLRVETGDDRDDDDARNDQASPVADHLDVVAEAFAWPLRRQPVGSQPRAASEGHGSVRR